MKYITRIGSITDIPTTSDFRVNYTKSWADDNGRAMDGAFCGSIIGIFPQIDVVFPLMSYEEQKLLLEEISQREFDMTWYDLKTAKYRTDSFYVNDIALAVFLPEEKIYENLGISFIAIDKLEHQDGYPEEDPVYPGKNL